MCVTYSAGQAGDHFLLAHHCTSFFPLKGSQTYTQQCILLLICEAQTGVQHLWSDTITFHSVVIMYTEYSLISMVAGLHGNYGDKSISKTTLLKYQ